MRSRPKRRSKKNRLLFLALLILIFFIAASREARTYLLQSLGGVFATTITPQDLQQRYQTSRLKILIVPGHDNEHSGTTYRGVREADLTLEMGKYLEEFLKDDLRFDVQNARLSATGEYTPELQIYFSSQREAIRQFRIQHTERLQRFRNQGLIATPDSAIHHGFANEEIGIKLYGINKWANEKDIDVVLHLHFNDYPRKIQSQPGRYEGFAIYIPYQEYPNGIASRSLAEALLAHLKNFRAISNLPQEKKGIIEDQELIATGANATQEGASLLIEYGYIYETGFINPAIRPHLLRELAFQTYQGLENYFQKESAETLVTRSSLLPREWAKQLGKGEKAHPSVLALQVMLLGRGFYPPAGKTLAECPLSGIFGPCLEKAVKSFQEKQGLPGTGFVGPATLKILNGGG